jgi:hypothetical protein
MFCIYKSPVYVEDCHAYVCSRCSLFYIRILLFREHGQGTSEELRSRDFRKELEDREKEKSGTRERRIQETVTQYV